MSVSLLHSNKFESYSDRLADFCKRSSVNRMAAGSRLSWCIMDFFSCLQLFKHTVLTYHLSRLWTWCPTDLQHLCCKALINKYLPFTSFILQYLYKHNHKCDDRKKVSLKLFTYGFLC